MECISIKCKNKPAPELSFCDNCLIGMLYNKLHIDDLVPGLEDSLEPNWERIKKAKRRARVGYSG